MVRTACCAVHRGRLKQRRHPAFPQGWGGARCQRVAMTCAQIAIMPRNNASEARAAASSNTERNIATSQGTKREQCSHYVLAVKWVVISRTPGPCAPQFALRRAMALV